MSMYRSIMSAALIGLPMASGFADEPPDAAALEAEGYIIGEVVLDKANVFDLSNPEENNWLYRGANRFHIMTRDKVVSSCCSLLATPMTSESLTNRLGFFDATPTSTTPISKQRKARTVSLT